jgi:hypothetical protein
MLHDSASNHVSSATPIPTTKSHCPLFAIFTESLMNSSVHSPENSFKIGYLIIAE